MCDTLIERETQQVALSFSDFGQSYSGLSGKNAEDFGDGYPFINVAFALSDIMMKMEL